jgi:putative ABC transport system permease protein
MGRLAWSQARFHPARTLALVLGVLIAATAFTVLTAASRTAQLRTIGAVSANYSPAYDILVRPAGARTSVEARTGSVQPDYLSGIYGGISLAQYQQIQQLPGVQVAAPIALVGYTELQVGMWEPVPASDLAGSGPQLYRISTSWVSDNGASRVTEPASYLYVTSRPLVANEQGGGAISSTGGECVLSGGLTEPQTSPFSTAAQSATICWSRVNGAGPDGLNTQAGYYINWDIPVLIAAVDPKAEAELDGLNKSLISGHYLTEDTSSGTIVPVLASSVSGLNEYAQTSLQKLTPPSTLPVMDAAWASAQAADPGRTVGTTRTTAQQAYISGLEGGTEDGLNPKRITAGDPDSATVTGYWTVGQVGYERTADGALTPRTVTNPLSVWYTGSPAAMDDEDTQYRAVTTHANAAALNTANGQDKLAEIQLAGVFDPARITSSDPLSQVPLGDYQAVTARPATAASRQALDGGDLLPSENVGGLVSQPADLITSLSALPALENDQAYSDASTARPISVIRVRVAGVSGANALSRERIKAVAQQIEQRTGLDVDIVAGSSPSPVTIDVPAGKFGQPALTLTEDWVKEGVAVAILNEVDKTSVVLFVLILVVCGLYVLNAATAAVRGRRRELGILASVGWHRSRLFATVLGELAGIGLAAGLAAAAVSLPVSAALGLAVSWERTLLAIPVAMAVAVIGGLVPAWLAARADPVSSVRPPVLAVRRARHPRGITSLALLNVTRTPGRSLIAMASLAVGIGALTLLNAVTFGFRGVVVGSLLGDAVALQVRGVDYIAAGATVTLGVVTVVDVVFLNIRERAAELATMRSFGWRDTALARLVITEGAIIGLAGSLAGAGIGLVSAAALAGQLPARLLVIAGVAVVAGIVITAAVTLLPAALLRRLPAAHLLAEE